MKKIILSSLVLMLSVHLIAQEEFFRNKGGMSLLYGYSHNKELGDFNSLGMAFTFKGGFSIGVASLELADEIKPQLHLGFLSAHKDKRFYMRNSMQLTYVSGAYARVIGANLGLSYLLNGNKQFPSSLNGVLSLNHINYKDQVNNAWHYSVTPQSEIVPVVGFAINQAFFAREVFTPYLGVGMGHDLNHNTSSLLLSFGINVNFNGKEKEREQAIKSH